MPHDAHPMGVLVSAMSALSVFHPDANPALRVSFLTLKHGAESKGFVFRKPVRICEWDFPLSDYFEIAAIMFLGLLIAISK